MATQIVKQPDGRYAIWSTIVDDFICQNMRPHQLVSNQLESMRNKEHVASVIEQLDAGKKPYGQFTMSYEDCLEVIKRHGVDI